MNKKLKYLLPIGLLGFILHTTIYYTYCQSKSIQGIAIAVISLLLFTATCLSYLNKGKGNLLFDSIIALYNILFSMLSYTFLFNAWCMIISKDSIWTISLIQSILYPIILSGFIGKESSKKSFRVCSALMFIITIASCSFSYDTNNLNILAIISYIFCIVIPSIYDWVSVSKKKVEATIVLNNKKNQNNINL